MYLFELWFSSGICSEVGLLGHMEDLLENEMATDSSVPAWEIPWAEQPHGLQAMWSQELDMT